jgi:hypothetical protein
MPPLQLGGLEAGKLHRAALGIDTAQKAVVVLARAVAHVMIRRGRIGAVFSDQFADSERFGHVEAR